MDVLYIPFVGTLSIVAFAAAVLVLLAGAAGAGIVAADLDGLFHRLTGNGAVAPGGLRSDLGHTLALDVGGLNPGGDDAADGLFLDGLDHLPDRSGAVEVFVSHPLGADLNVKRIADLSDQRQNAQRIVYLTVDQIVLRFIIHIRIDLVHDIQ